MPPLDTSSLRAYLRSTNFADWLRWCSRVPDPKIAGAIRALLMDADPGSSRDAASIRADLFTLACSEARFREFLETEATADAITAGFLQEQLDKE